MLALLAAATLKLCLPSNMTVPYTHSCPAGTTSVKKVCPSGAIVPYSSKCPVAPPPPPPPPTPSPLVLNGRAVGTKACTSVTNPADTTMVGAPYTVVGFAGWSQPGDPPTTAKDIVILNDDATHRGDGWFGIYVPVDCAAGAP